jgi:hypothetical protein
VLLGSKASEFEVQARLKVTNVICTPEFVTLYTKSKFRIQLVL